MKAVILAAGKGTKLRPLTDPLDKGMLPIYNKPVIVHLIETLIKADVKEILVVFHTSTINLYEQMLKQQSFYEILTFTDDPRLLGPAKTLELARDWVNGNDFVLTFGDSVFFEELPKLNTKIAPHMFVMKMGHGEDDLSRYGQVEVLSGKVIKKIDKPKLVFSDIIQATLWILPPNVFDKAKEYKKAVLEPDNFRISALIDRYIEKEPVDCTFLPPNSYLDCGDLESLFKANKKMREKILSRK